MPRPATGSITEATSGWRLRFRAYGKRESITLSRAEAPTRKRAEEELANVLADVRRGIWQPQAPTVPASVMSPQANPTFQLFAEAWYAAKWPTLAESTRSDYEWRLNRHLLPWFSAMPVSAITVAAVDEYRDAKLAAWETNKRARTAARSTSASPHRVAGPESINKTLVLLRSILDVAVERDLLGRNPLTVNPRNRKVRVRREDKPQRTYLSSADQVTALLDAAERKDRSSSASPGVRRATVALMTFGGLRISEAVALRWGDVNLADGRLTVRGTKTDAAARVVPMLPVLRDELSAWKARAAHSGPSDPVVANGDGHRWHSDNVRSRIVNAAVAEANDVREANGQLPLPRVTPHGLRRTAASLWAALDWPMPDTMRALGHTSPTLTLSVYAQAMDLGNGERSGLRALAEGGGWDTAGRAAVPESVVQTTG